MLGRGKERQAWSLGEEIGRRAARWAVCRIDDPRWLLDASTDLEDKWITRAFGREWHGTLDWPHEVVSAVAEDKHPLRRKETWRQFELGIREGFRSGKPRTRYRVGRLSDIVKVVQGETSSGDVRPHDLVEYESAWKAADTPDELYNILSKALEVPIYVRLKAERIDTSTDTGTAAARGFLALHKRPARKPGRKSALTPAKRKEATLMLRDGAPKSLVAEKLGIDRRTLYRAIDRKEIRI